MELRDLAERILFAATLEQKLGCPEIITDEQPGSPRDAPGAPNRPPELLFKPSGAGKADFPGLHRLGTERERGRLLHFFANHELLATELMALALLRFPDAPPAFRRGLLRTLKDEQIHTRLYIQRMHECGIAFGQLPVSGYFWRAVSPMESPLDYVASLCLTFEQANLDFCRSFARGFLAVGDEATAQLLERIYRDEIGHVAYGLNWFRRWKNPQQTDWEAFCQQLKFPLSPTRAKGLTLNVEGRRAAGFGPEFIAELNVHAQSKGRTPNVFVFNPFTEAYIRHGKSFTPVQHQARLSRDLANLPQFLCRQDDIVLVPERPSVQFLSGLKQAGFALPEFVELKGQVIDPASSLARRKIGRLRPWAWGPDSAQLLQPLFGNVTGETRTPTACFNADIARLYSKTWSAALLKKILVQGAPGDTAISKVADAGATENSEATNCRAEPSASWLCPLAHVGAAADTLEGALDTIQALRARGHQRVVAKQALGLAGHNAIRLWEPQVLDSQRRWLAKAVQDGGQLIIEPWLERVLDFSVQLEMSPRGLELCGYTGLSNDLKGQYQANWAAANYARRLPASVAEFLGRSGDVSGQIQRLYADVFRLLEVELRGAGYLGPVGIDAFVYRTPEGECQLKPIVEINPRYTFGRLSVELMKRTCPGSCGLLRLVTQTLARAEGHQDLAAYARTLVERFPLRLEGEPVSRIREGALCLNDPARAQACLAVLQVGPDCKFQLNREST